ncbi:MAG: hypothetical protein QOF78_1428 [Phycisphaerales bacterium]|jgi:hypothetical protein|nr:hypothetical protein [Phycisphaerales bacterium]
MTRKGKPVGVEVVFMGKELPGWEKELNIPRIAAARQRTSPGLCAVIKGRDPFMTAAMPASR